MKNIVLKGLLFVVIIGVILLINFLSKVFPIATGYAAKTACSCLFISERDLNSIKGAELAKLSYVNLQVNEDEKSVSTDILGIAERKAVYKKGQGCILLFEGEYKPVKTNYIRVSSSRFDTIPWPEGNLMDSAFASFSIIDQNKLTNALTKDFSEPYPDMKRRARAVVVVHKNKIVAEKYANGFNESTKLTGWSMTKSITNALIGTAVKDFKLDINEAIGGKYWNDDRSGITWDHLLRMSSGLDFEEVYGKPSDATFMLFNSNGAWTRAIRSKLEVKPDEKWYYSSGTSNLLIKFLSDTLTGLNKDYLSYPYSALFDKIGMTSAEMELDASGNFVGSSFCFATARDWAKFGLLYLNDGVWANERILPEGWVKYSSAPTAKAEKGQYGAHFWLNAGLKPDGSDRRWPNLPRDIFFASGFEGQKVFIIPSYDLVIVRLGLYDDTEAWDYGSFLEDVLASFNQ